jgi:hypothetical protein
VAIAAFEVGAGCGRFAIVWLINLWALALGSSAHHSRSSRRTYEDDDHTASIAIPRHPKPSRGRPWVRYGSGCA